MDRENIKLSDVLGESIGRAYDVDTRKVLVDITSEEDLNHLKINDLVLFPGSNQDEKLIGIVTKVSKKRTIELSESEEIEDDDEIPYCKNFCGAALVGTFYNKIGVDQTNVFKRAINTYPEINSEVYKANDDALFIIMNSLSKNVDPEHSLKIGKFANNTEVLAILDGDRFFQRHACIVGSTGSGKSCTVANILEKINKLNHSNAIVFDLHGEYNELPYSKNIKISADDGGLKIPLWFFNYEEIHSMFIESSEGSSSNQRAVVIEYILRKKKEYIEASLKEFDKSIITVDTPIPFSAAELKEYLSEKNVEVQETGEVYASGEHKGQSKTKQGQFYDKLTNLITRLQSKLDDKKYSFVFNEEKTSNHTYLNSFANEILSFENQHHIKVIDLSEIPADILPIIIGVVTRILYDIQFWMTPNKEEERHPLVFVCDEAHIYMPNDSSKLKAVDRRSLEIFETIAKEGRKYGVGLLIVSQRPSDLNTTIISQCNNIISLKITNDRDKSAVNNMLTDSLSGLTEMLPNLDVGECIVVGDAIMLPSKIILDMPQTPPKSATIQFWSKWYSGEKTIFDIDQAVNNMIKQSR